MKVLLSFLIGIACGAAVMFQLIRTGCIAPELLSSPLAATAVNTRPAPPVTAPAPPMTVMVAAPLSVAPPAVEMHVELPARAASVLVAGTSVPGVIAANHADTVGSGSAVVPPDVPAMAVNGLLIPVQGVQPADLRDTFTQTRSSDRAHEAIDIMAPRGTPVLAANAGRVVKLFTSKPGGLTVYQFDPSEHVIYYYAHLDSYAPGLAEGQQLQRGDPVGSVGSTGDASADAPHLHFEVQLLGPERQWWHGTSINPYGRFAGQ